MRHSSIVVIAGLCAAGSLAQGIDATALGVCLDDTGRAVEAVRLAFENEATGFRREARSTADGSFRARFLPSGRYRIEMSKAGFQTLIQTGVELSVGGQAQVGCTLRVSALATQVEVVAELSQVETTNPLMSTLVDAKKVSDLPLNGRDLMQLMQLQPGVQAARTDPGDIVTGSKGTRITVAGARPSTNVFMLDGTVINNLGNRVAGGATGSLTGVETVKEFRAYTNSYSAEFSRAAGGAFNIVTKSGTNAWHGSAFEFLRNDNLDARNFFDGARPEFRRNQFGGSLGGPIVRDRTFFFGSFEGFRQQLGQTILRTVPDHEARQGRLNGVDVGVAPAVRPYVALWPAQTSDPVPGDGSALYTRLFTQPVQENFYNARVDHQLSATDSLFARYTISDSSQSFLSDEVFPEYPNRLTNRPQFVTLQETKILSASAINELRLGFARSNPLERMQAENIRPEMAFIPGQAQGAITIGGFDAFGPDRNVPRRLTQNSFQLNDQVAITRGRHAFTAGMQVERLHYNVVSASQLRGEFRFTNLANFLRGTPSSFDGVLPGAADFTRGYRQTLAGWYVQDALRLSRRLTVNLGLRHEFVTVPTEQHGRLNNLLSLTDARVTVGPPFTTGKTNFAPRVGFALDPRGDGRTAIRGGFGLFYVPFVANQWWNSMVRLPPFAVTARATGAAATFPNAAAGLAALGRESISSIDARPDQPYMLHFNLNVQRQLARSTVATIAYTGSRGIHLGREADFNIGGPNDPVRRNPNFARIRLRTWDARSFYNSLQASLQRQFRAGLQFQLSYTFAKSIDEASGELGRIEFNNGQARTSDPYNRRNDRALSSFDVRQNLTANLTWDLPGRYGRGWQVNNIVTFTSGIPFTPIIIADLDRDGTDDNEQRPNLRPGASNNPVLGRPEQWFDPAAFTSIEAGARGNLGRNTIMGPGLAMVDLSLAKTFSLPRWDRAQLQLRIETFNALNRANFSSPTRANLEIFTEAGPAAAALPTVGRITSTSTTARQSQLALRLVF